jgi:hypothetical protein
MEEVFILMSIYENVGQEWHEEKILGVFTSPQDADKAKKIAESIEPSWSQSSSRYFMYYVYESKLYSDPTTFTVKKRNLPKE